MTKDKKRTTGQLKKKAAVLNQTRRRLRPSVVLTGFFAIAGALALGLYLTDIDRSQTHGVSAIGNSDVQVFADSVSYRASQFDDGKARHFELRADDITIRYFILKSSDGVIRAAIDACDVCWPSGKGYRQEGDEMVCQNCGRRFASVLVNEVQGGCNPSPLPRIVQGDHLIIKTQDILEGHRYFNFNGKA